LINILAISR